MNIPIRRFMRPTNKRIRQRRYILIFLICLVLVVFLNAANRLSLINYETEQMSIIAYHLVEKNYIKTSELDFTNDIEPMWKDRDEIKMNRNVMGKVSYMNKIEKKKQLKYTIFENTKNLPKFCHLFDKPDQYVSKTIYTENCPYKNCFFTCDKNNLKNIDAIIVYEDDNVKTTFDVDVFQLKNKIKIFWKTLKNNYYVPKYDRFQFNWTISYRIDGEISDCTHGCVYSTKNYFNIDETIAIKSHKLLVKRNFEERLNETLMIIDDDCSSRDRIEIAMSLNYFSKINFKGACLSISNNNVFYSGPSNNIRFMYEKQLLKNNAKTQSCEFGSMCQKELFKIHKFFLSIEEFNCTDHVTEMFWLALESDIIPVVFFPNREFYEMFAPKTSFIHAQDFDYDVKRLADHLAHVSSNFAAYLDYFAWKFYLSTTKDRELTQKRLMCELCYKLNTDNSVTYYASLTNWFKKGCETQE